MQEEIWKPILKFNGTIEVSNLGRIRSLDRIIKRKNHTDQKRKGKILKAPITRDGYELLMVTYKGKNYARTVHRIVLEAFLGWQDKQVNHIDGNKTNNKLDNLEYCTCRQNVIHFWKDKETTSKYNGVCFDKSRKKWIASITHNGVQYNLGRFKTEQEALDARRKYEVINLN